jgi:tellurite resistance protein TerC
VTTLCATPLLAVAESPWPFVGFVALVLVFLALDLGVFHRQAREVGVREAVVWTLVWIGAALAFAFFVHAAYERHWLGLGLEVPQLGGPPREVGGPEAVLLYLTGYIVEKSLSLDNVFVIALVFTAFRVPPALQHRVLFWGILGALLLRGAMIAAGAALVHSFDWITYLFGALLVVTAIKMARVSTEDVDPRRNPLVRLVRRWLPVSSEFHGNRFLVREGGRLVATPLLLGLAAVEFSDVIFAVDSIPAIFAITLDPFLVFTSNVFAILGLRALYFCLAGLLDRFRYLKVSLIAVLFFVGVKMLLVHTPWRIPLVPALLVLGGLLAGGVVASVLRPLPPRLERRLPGPEGVLARRAPRPRAPEAEGPPGPPPHPE